MVKVHYAKSQGLPPFTKPQYNTAVKYKINIDFPIPYSMLKFAESAKNHTPTGPSPSIIIIMFQGPMNTTYLDFY